MSPARTNGQAPAYDLEASARAAAAESEAHPFVFTYKATTYTVPPSSTWPMPALRALAAGDLDGALSTLLGDEAYEGLCAAGLTLGELAHLFEAVSADSGLVSLPNSSAPALPASTRT